MNALEVARKLFNIEEKISKLKITVSSNAQAIATLDYVGEAEKMTLEREYEEAKEVLNTLLPEKEHMEKTLREIEIW